MNHWHKVQHACLRWDPRPGRQAELRSGRLLRMLTRIGQAALGLVLALCVLGSLGCYPRDWGKAPASGAPTVTITPGWTIPAPPNTIVGQNYTLSVTEDPGYTCQWSVVTGNATLINATTPILSFTPTAAGDTTLRCVVTGPANETASADYTVHAGTGAVLNAQPGAITLGQGTILLATFTGTTGVINPGAITVTSSLGVVVNPTVTTVYTLNVDGTDVATTTVNVLQFVPKFVYVSDNDYAISAFSLDTATGALTELAGSPFGAGDIVPDQLALTPDGKFLYAAGESHGVYGFTLDGTTGVLTPMPGSPFATDPNGNADVYNIAVDPFGRFLYTSGDDGNVYGFAVDPATGALTPVPGSSFAAGSNDRGGVLVHPSGLYTYAVASNDAAVHAFSINQSTGALAEIAGSPFDASGSEGTPVVGPYGVAVDSTGAYFFTKGEGGRTDNQYMAGFSIDIANGALTPMAASPFGPFPGDDAFHGLAFHPTRSILYTAFYDSNPYDAGAFSLDLATGTLTQLGLYNLFTSDHGSDNIVIDRSGQFAFSTNYGSNRISRMRVAADGSLTKLDGSPLGAGDVDLTPVGDSPDSIVVGGTLVPIVPE